MLEIRQREQINAAGYEKYQGDQRLTLGLIVVAQRQCCPAPLLSLWRVAMFERDGLRCLRLSDRGNTNC